MTGSFVHLHNHTSYSLLDGAAKIEPLIQAAKQHGQPGIACTDHGNLYGLVDFYNTCHKYDLNPILGIETYFADDRFERGQKSSEAQKIDGTDKRYYHLTVLAENNTGYQNLLKLSSDSFLEGYYFKPRADWELLERYSEGLIVTTGCLGGPVLQALLNDRYDVALSKAARLQDIFGRDNLFVELQDHGIPEQKRTNPYLIEIARELDAPLIAANDCHYVHPHDAESHDILLCMQTHAKKSDEKRFKFQSDQHYLKSAQEMRYLFSELPDACDNTLLINERANVSIDFQTLHLPVYEPPERFGSPSEFLTYLAHRGLQKRREGNPSNDDIERLAYELATIDSQGLSSYFLIVWDLVRFADRQEIRRGPARGSVAGSLVAYCLDISRVDPMRHNLLFERFINPDRIALADIDLDFDSRYRDDLIRYTFEKYGDDRVAQIITFQKIRARAAVRDSCRVLGYDSKVGDRISKAMPPLVMGESTPIEACFELNPRYEIGYNNAQELRTLYATDPEVKHIIDVAKDLEGLIRQDGIHAAAVVITPDDIRNYLPIQRKPDKKSPTGYGPIVTQYEKNAIEDLGLLKMDYLGLRNLDIISETIRILGYDPGVDLTDFDDIETYNLLRAGDTIGVFQLESKPMQMLLRRMQPNSIDDIAAVVALYRPGPMASNMHNDYADRKNGRQPISYFHEDAKEILEKTYGLMIYQEQVMQVAQRFAGYTMSEADSLRKIIGKKLIDKMASEKEKFVSGCIESGYGEQLGHELFDMIEAFAAYAFNASHAYGYAYVSYQTAFLKANFPVQYMAALTSSVATEIEKCAVFLNEARQMGITVKTPDINKSESLFFSEGNVMLVGLSAIKNIGKGLSEKIIAERNENGQFSSLIDFVERVNPSSDQVASLALAGALDQFGTRLGISTVSKDIVNTARKTTKKQVDGQASMFDTEELWTFKIPESEYGWRNKLSKEREAIGLYISGHPLDDHMQHATGTTLSDALEAAEKTMVEVLVEIAAVERKITRAGQAMGHLVVSDQTGVIDDIVVFPRAWSQASLTDGDLGVLKFKISTNIATEKRSYVFEDFVSVTPREEVDVDVAAMKLFLPQGFAQDDAAISRLKGVLLSHYGDHSVILYVSRSTRLELPAEIKVDASDALKQDLKHLFNEFSSR